MCTEFKLQFFLKVLINKNLPTGRIKTVKYLNGKYYTETLFIIQEQKGRWMNIQLYYLTGFSYNYC